VLNITLFILMKILIGSLSGCWIFFVFIQLFFYYKQKDIVVNNPINKLLDKKGSLISILIIIFHVIISSLFYSFNYHSLNVEKVLDRLIFLEMFILTFISLFSIVVSNYIQILISSKTNTLSNKKRQTFKENN